MLSKLDETNCTTVKRESRIYLRKQLLNTTIEDKESKTLKEGCRISVIMSLSTKVQIWRMELRCFCLSRCVKQLFNCMFRSIRTDSRHSKNIQSIIPCNCAVSHTSFISVSIPNNDSNHKQFMNNETRTKPR